MVRERILNPPSSTAFANRASAVRKALRRAGWPSPVGRRGEADANVAVAVVPPLPSTVSRNALLAWRVPSLTEIVIRAVPVFPLDGVTFTVRFEPLPPKTICEVGTNVGFDEAPDKMRFA